MAKKFTALGACAEGAASAHGLKGISQLGGVEMQLRDRDFLTLVHFAELAGTIYKHDNIDSTLQGDNLAHPLSIHPALTLYSLFMRQKCSI
jgi:hypothetical protein